MKFKSLILVTALLALLLQVSCGKSFEDLYPGVWEITFDGSFSGKKTMIIKDDGSFDFSIVLSQGLFGSTTNRFIGTVSKKGKVTADIYMNNSDIGDVVGTLNDKGVGFGVYVTNVNTEGSWIAVKK